MTYQVNGKIEDTDFNTLAASFNQIWGTGSGNQGYGQSTTLSNVANNDLVQATNYWNALTTRISTISNHQNTSISSMTPQPTTDGKIIYLQNIVTNLTTINNGRLNALSQGATSSTTTTSGSSFNAKMTTTITVNFESINAARYYFNAGGQIGLSFSHPNTGGINELFSDICAEAGTIWLSSPIGDQVTLSGVVYNGVTKIGGVVSNRSSINSAIGYYALPTSDTQLFLQTSDAGPTTYFNSSLVIFARINDSGAARQIIFTCVFDVIPNGLTVSAGTTSTLTLRPPSTAYLSNTWGTPTVSGEVSYSTVSSSTFSNPGTYTYTVPAGVNQLEVRYPSTTTGVGRNVVAVTPNATYTVIVGDFGQGSSISSAFNTPAWNLMVLNFNGIVDATCYIDQQVISSIYRAYVGTDLTAGLQNQGAAAQGIYYREYNELNHGDYPSTISIAAEASTNMLYSYRVAITYYGGRGGGRAGAYIFQQPAASNNNVMRLYIEDGWNHAAWSPIQVSLQQIVGLTITPL